MTSSGTYNFNLSNADIVIGAFERIQIRAPELRQEHWVTARRELNALLVELSNRQVNLFSVQLVSTSLTQGTASYSVNSNVVMILDAYISLNEGTSTQTDRYIIPLSRTEYASIAEKQTQGFPTSYWFDRVFNQTVTFWPIPDGNGPYTFNYYACLQMQDANLPSGETPGVTYLWLDVLLAGLSHRLARVYAPNLEAPRMADYDKAWQWAAEQNTESVNFKISPQLNSYYLRR